MRVGVRVAQFGALDVKDARFRVSSEGEQRAKHGLLLDRKPKAQARLTKYTEIWIEIAYVPRICGLTFEVQKVCIRPDSDASLIHVQTHYLYTFSWNMLLLSVGLSPCPPTVSLCERVVDLKSAGLGLTPLILLLSAASPKGFCLLISSSYLWSRPFWPPPMNASSRLLLLPLSGSSAP